MKTKYVIIVMAVSLTAIVSFAILPMENPTGMEYWGEVFRELYNSDYNCTDKVEIRKKHSRSFTTSTDGIEWLKQNSGCINSVSVTSKGLTVKYDVPVGGSDLPIELEVETFDTDASFMMHGCQMGGIRRGLALGEELTLPLDKKTILKRSGVCVVFSPVTFKNRKNGFKISATVDFSVHGRKMVSNTLYVALSDKPVEVGEEDVDKEILITTESSDGVSFLKRFWFDRVSVTSKALSLWFAPKAYEFEVEVEGVKRLASEYKANDEPLVLLPGQSARLVGEREHDHTIEMITFTPVLFKNRRNLLEGFRVMVRVNRLPGSTALVADTRYIVLSDTPMLMGEAELEMDEVKISKHNLKKSVTARKGKTIANVTEDGQGESPHAPSRLWLCALIPFCALAIFYFLWRKKR